MTNKAKKRLLETCFFSTSSSSWPSSVTVAFVSRFTHLISAVVYEGRLDSEVDWGSRPTLGNVADLHFLMECLKRHCDVQRKRAQNESTWERSCMFGLAQSSADGLKCVHRPDHGSRAVWCANFSWSFPKADTRFTWCSWTKDSSWDTTRSMWHLCAIVASLSLVGSFGPYGSIKICRPIWEEPAAVCCPCFAKDPTLFCRTATFFF